MAGREQPYDPYIPSGSNGQQGGGQYDGGNARTAAIQSVRGHFIFAYKRAGDFAITVRGSL